MSTDHATSPPGSPGGAPPSRFTDPEVVRLNSCFHLLGRVEDQLRFADSKACFIATLHAFLVSPLITIAGEVRRAFSHWDGASLNLLTLLGLAYTVLFLASMGWVGMTVVPRSRPLGRAPSRVFFGRIAREFSHAPDAFAALVLSMSDHDWLEEISLAIVEVSAIAAAKHRCARWATLLTIPAVIVWCLTVLVIFCASPTAAGVKPVR